MSKPTRASVTIERCRCRYLDNAANDPESPIIFDERAGEFQFSYGGAMLVIYHCPWCGGAAPASKRHLLFAQIPKSEEGRLAKLFESVETIGEAIAAFGQPDCDDQSVTRHHESENEPPEIQHHRHVVFQNLSEVADVHFTERPDGGAWWRLSGKPLKDAGR